MNPPPFHPSAFALQRLLRRWQASGQDCLLCGTSNSPALLCPPCQADLPRHAHHSCQRCAQVAPTGPLCGTCLANPPHFDTTIAHWDYRFPLDGLIQALKYGHQLALADFFAGSLLQGPHPAGDLLLAVPLSARRLRERGFNQAVEIARPIARQLKLPLALDICLRTRETAAQAELPWKARRKNIRHAFECRADLSGKRVIVVDDVMTTGATLDELARTLKNHGAATVTNWIVARTPKDHGAD